MSLGVLLVEDDRELRATLAEALRVEGYRVQACASLADARAVLGQSKGLGQGQVQGRPPPPPDTARGTRAPAPAGAPAAPPGPVHPVPPHPGPPDLVLLDLGLPDGDGDTLLAELRRDHRMPVIVISARPGEDGKVRLLDAGADDYLVKPFSLAELLARMRVALRHRGTVVPAATLRYEQAGLVVDLAAHQVLRDGREVHLTPTEYKLLARLVRQAGQVVTHRQLLLDVWGPEYTEHTHYLRLYMAQLRAKLEAEPADPRLLLTEPAVGYRLAEPGEG